MSTSAFIDSLMGRVPEAAPTVQEHLRDYDGDVLLHLLISDLRRLAVTWFEDSEADRLARLLSAVEIGLSEGDSYVENAIAISFVEEAAWWDPTQQAFLATWPRTLAEEVESQREGAAREQAHRLRLQLVRQNAVRTKRAARWALTVSLLAMAILALVRSLLDGSERLWALGILLPAVVGVVSLLVLGLRTPDETPG